MTTAQNAVSNAPFNPPPSVNHFANESRIEEPTSNSIPYPSHVQIDPTPLPWRCQFTFSDGRQCRMPRHEFHVCLCKYHARREEELWGDPECSTARQLDGLFDDLSTATGINRALAQVFRMLAQKRITQREAVAFGYLAQLLLQTVRGVRSEAISAFGLKAWTETLTSKLNPTPEPAAQAIATEREAQQILPDVSSLSAHPSTPPEATALAEFAPPSKSAPTASPASAVPDYEDLLTRSLDLLAGQPGATTEDVREARRLLGDLERLGQTEARSRLTAADSAVAQYPSLNRAECALTNRTSDQDVRPERRNGARDLSAPPFMAKGTAVVSA